MKTLLKTLGCLVLLAATAAWTLGADPAPPAPAAASPAPAAAKPAAEARPAADKLVAVVKIVEGTVETRPALGQPWVPVKAGDSLAEGADIRTGFRARCVLEMNKNALQVGPLAVSRIDELRRDGETVRTRILLKQGSTETNVEKKNGVKNDFTIVTPTATLSVRGTNDVQASFFPGFGGNYGLGGSGLINVTSNFTGTQTGVLPGGSTNDNAMPPGQLLAQQFNPMNIDPRAFEQNEQDANSRWHTSLPAPPGLGGSTTSGSSLGVVQQSDAGGGGEGVVIPRPKDDYGGYEY
ncbi:MAG: hypothetical protein NTX87_15065 [Planctomycetota bacterium]|nr:hypothetical protein [Planctomycetota bacterium]